MARLQCRHCKIFSRLFYVLSDAGRNVQNHNLTFILWKTVWLSQLQVLKITVNQAFHNLEDCRTYQHREKVFRSKKITFHRLALDFNTLWCFRKKNIKEHFESDFHAFMRYKSLERIRTVYIHKFLWQDFSADIVKFFLDCFTSYQMQGEMSRTITSLSFCGKQFG